MATVKHRWNVVILDEEGEAIYATSVPEDKPERIEKARERMYSQPERMLRLFVYDLAQRLVTVEDSHVLVPRRRS